MPIKLSERLSAGFALIGTHVRCPECARVFDLQVELDADEWFYGHDCEVGS
jgi:hypothetical protein